MKDIIHLTCTSYFIQCFFFASTSTHTTECGQVNLYRASVTSESRVSMPRIHLDHACLVYISRAREGVGCCGERGEEGRVGVKRAKGCRSLPPWTRVWWAVYHPSSHNDEWQPRPDLTPRHPTLTLPYPIAGRNPTQPNPHPAWLWELLLPYMPHPILLSASPFFSPLFSPHWTSYLEIH